MDGLLRNTEYLFDLVRIYSDSNVKMIKVLKCSVSHLLLRENKRQKKKVLGSWLAIWKAYSKGINNKECLIFFDIMKPHFYSYNSSCKIITSALRSCIYCTIQQEKEQCNYLSCEELFKFRSEFFLIL